MTSTDKIAVFIATTQGPSRVLKISEEDPLVQSVVCLDGTSQALGISANYAAFVRNPTGVVEKYYHHGAFRVDVSDPITGGESWQFGLLCAHALHQQNRLAHKDEPFTKALWISGRINRDLNVLCVDHIPEKLKASGDLFQWLKAKSIPTILCLAPENATLAETMAPQDHRIKACKEFGDLCAVINLPSPQTKSAQLSKRPRIAYGVIAIAGLGLIASLGGWLWQAQPNATPAHPHPVALSINSLKASPDAGCNQPVSQLLSDRILSRQDLCQIEIVVQGQDDQKYLWSFVRTLPELTFVAGERKALLQSAPQTGPYKISFKPNPVQSAYRITALMADTPLSDISGTLLEMLFSPDPAKEKTIITDLEQRGIKVLSKDIQIN